MNSLQPSPLYKREYEHDACGVGFLANINGERSHGLLKKTIQALKNLAHRGAIDADAITGDGAGILTQIPYPLFRDFLQEKGKNLYKDDDLGVGTIFLPRDDEYAQSHAKQIVETAVKDDKLPRCPGYSCYTGTRKQGRWDITNENGKLFWHPVSSFLG